MPSRAHYRSRNNAIGRKGAYETEFLFSEDENIELKPQLKSETVRNVTSQPSSPTSVASTLIPNEIQPFTLPGSWVVVGKGGKPLKNEKMYDEPVAPTSAKKKKKRRPRSRKAAELIDPEPLIATFAESGSSSKCLRELHHSATRHEKEVTRSKDAKRWARYQVAKQLKRSALDELAAPELADTASCQADWPLPMARTLPTKDNKANGNKDKARRRARSAAIAARCSFWDENDGHVELESASKEARPPLPRSARMSGELQLCFGPLATSEEASTRVQLPGAWTAVGKRGKKMNDFPPLQAVDKAAGKTAKLSAEATLCNKRRKSSEQGSPKQSNKREKSAGTSIKCSVM